MFMVIFAMDFISFLYVSYSDVRYITFLRDPVERTLSAIRFNIERVEKNRGKKRNPGMFADKAFQMIYEDYVSDKRSVDFFLDTLYEQNILRDQMTKQLSGMATLSNISLSQELKDSALWFPPYFHELESYSEPAMEMMIEAALNNLKEYDFIGIQEDMEDSMERFKAAFPHFRMEPKGKFKSTDKSSFKVTEKHLDIIKEMNRYDMRLYKKAKELI